MDMQHIWQTDVNLCFDFCENYFSALNSFKCYHTHTNESKLSRVDGVLLIHHLWIPAVRGAWEQPAGVGEVMKQGNPK